jgi:hypothetical protein
MTVGDDHTTVGGVLLPRMQVYTTHLSRPACPWSMWSCSCKLSETQLLGFLDVSFGLADRAYSFFQSKWASCSLLNGWAGG